MNVRFDSDANATYVSYPKPRNSMAAQTIRIGNEFQDVFADITDFGEVIGIEILNPHSEVDVEAARKYAKANGLPFPDSVLENTVD